MWVQDKHFSEKRDSIYADLKRKIVSTGIRSMGCGANSLPLSCLIDLLMTGHKISVYQVQKALFTNQSAVLNCQKMTNCERFRAKCCVNLAATLTYHR